MCHSCEGTVKYEAKASPLRAGMKPINDERSMALCTKTAPSDDSRTPTNTGVGLGSPSTKNDPASDRRASSASPRQVDGTASGMQAGTQAHHASMRGPTHRPRTTAKPAWFGQGAFGDVGLALLSHEGILVVYGGEDVNHCRAAISFRIIVSQSSMVPAPEKSRRSPSTVTEGVPPTPIPSPWSLSATRTGS